MRNTDPAFDLEMRDRDSDNEFYTLTLTEYLTESVNIMGLQFDAKALATFTRRGSHGDIELDSIEIGDVYLVNENAPDSEESLFLLDQDSFRSRHRRLYDLVIKAIQDEGVRVASQSKVWERVED